VFTEFAPAKINLSLHITGRRADGLHLLDSLVAFASVGDQVSAQAAAGLELRCAGPYAKALGEDNLVLQAARRMQAAFTLEQGALLLLDKQLPVASGIGGGSADAAATLRVLKRLWNLPDDGPWQEIALGLGADVPVCLASKTCRMTGIGEIMQPETIPGYFLVLVNPNQALMTKDVFGRFAAIPRDAHRKNKRAGLLDGGNDLEPAAISLMPVIARMLEILRISPGCELARMSGSGATCFGLFTREADAAAAADRIGGERPGWWVRAAKIPYGA
jgi:4-diphosphocytidyl-2-C-methyl-D-erythritol kinase